MALVLPAEQVLMTAGTEMPHQVADLNPVQKCFLLGTLLVGALLPLVPDTMSPLTVSFSLLFGCLAIAGNPGRLRQALDTGPGRALLALFFAILVSYPAACWNGTPWTIWFRGAIPFIFLAIYYFVAPVRREQEQEFLLNGLQLATLCWAVKILISTGSEIPQVISGRVGRLTYADLDTLIPYGLLGFIIALFNPSRRFAAWRWPSLALFGLLIFACAYRSQLVLCLLAVAIYCYRRMSPRTLVLTGMLGAAASGYCVACSYNPLEADVIQARLNRFETTADEPSTRHDEIDYAFRSFLESPLIGNGLGFQVPAYVLFGDRGAAQPNVPQTAGYIHNVWFYLLMDLGLFGLGAYVTFVGLAVYRGVHPEKRRSRAFRNPDFRSLEDLGSVEGDGGRQSEYRFCAALALAGLLAFLTVQASFRSLQTNLAIALLAAVATAMPERRRLRLRPENEVCG